MPAIDGNVRKLHYPLNITMDKGSITEDDPIEHKTLSGWTTTDNDERIDIVLNLSLNEYITLANTIDVGRDIAYGENSIAVWWLWIRTIKSMAICESMIECMVNDAQVRDAIQRSVSGGANVNGSEYFWSQDILPPVVGCDFDTTWGYCKAMWDYINQLNQDFLQQLSEAGNLADQIGEMVSAIPVFGLLPFDEIIAWVGNLGDYNLEAYNASITVEVNTQIYCDLFCIAKNNNCSLTFEMVWEYMLEKFGGANFPTLGATFVELTTFMVTGTYFSDRIVYLWTLVQLGIAFIGAEWFGSNQMALYSIYGQIGDPDNDWILLCDECVVTNTIEVTYDVEGYADYTVLEGTINSSFGNPSPSGKSSYNAGITTTRNVTRVNLPASATVTGVSCDAWSNQVSLTSTVLMQYFDEFDVLLGSDAELRTEQSSWWKSTFNGVDIDDVAYVKFFIAKDESPHVLYQDNLKITYVV